MKGDKKILIVAILLLLIAVSYGTYAIYKTSLSGTGTVTAAKWAIEFKNGSDTMTDTFSLEFDSTDCSNPHVATGVIAPGASCTKTVTLDASGTEVDVLYEVTANTAGILVDGAAQPANSNTITASVGTNDGVIYMSDTGQSDEIEVTITWDGQEGSGYDAGDTTMGVSQSVITVPITLVAKQYVGS